MIANTKKRRREMTTLAAKALRLLNAHKSFKERKRERYFVPPHTLSKRFGSNREARKKNKKQKQNTRCNMQ